MRKCYQSDSLRIFVFGRNDGAKNPAEFFAVATEAFFERPLALREKQPDLYAQLTAFYRQDPACHSAVPGTWGALKVTVSLSPGPRSLVCAAGGRSDLEGYRSAPRELAFKTLPADDFRNAASDPTRSNQARPGSGNGHDQRNAFSDAGEIPRAKAPPG